jgi:hypothetical protein
MLSSMSRLPVEDVDLAALTEGLRRRFSEVPPVGYLEGRTALRDAVQSALACSQLEAEDLVETLVARGFVRYEGDPLGALDDPRPWAVG